MNYFVGDHESHERLLAVGDGTEKARVDYSVLSVGVMTLGLIMIVEVVRHKIDHVAEKRPFSKAVLDGVYSELATLGIVELFLFMLSTYYEDLDKQKYYVFADIHFALFYTAIFNAFQSVVVAAVSNRVAHRIWVQTENLELNHYVEIREEFEHVKEELERIAKHSEKESVSEDSTDGDGESSVGYTKREITLWESIVYRFRYPALRSRYNALLLQIHFHELRVHFLDAYKLPLMLKISHYLLMSQQQVLLKLVHVSSIAWTLLTGAINILYYVLGLVSYKVADSTVVGTALIWIYFWSMAIFVLIAGVVYWKMKSVFRTIMVEKTLWDVNNVHDELKESMAQQQLDLFWGSDPKLVIAALQFMQFGYAVTFAVIVIYWQEIDNGSVPIFVYLLVSFVCYGMFVLVTAQVIPKYTMCTSLGQLVDEKRLQETVATFFLEEARRKESEKLLLDAIGDDIVPHGGPSNFSKLNTINKNFRVTSSLSIDKNLGERINTTVNDPSNRKTSDFKNQVGTGQLMAELVRLDTDSLRTNLPASEHDQLVKRDKTNRRNRRKARSEGVMTMATASSSSSLASSVSPVTSKDDLTLVKDSSAKKAEVSGRESVRRSRKSLSDGVLSMSMTRDPISSENTEALGLEFSESGNEEVASCPGDLSQAPKIEMTNSGNGERASITDQQIGGEAPGMAKSEIGDQELASNSVKGGENEAPRLATAKGEAAEGLPPQDSNQHQLVPLAKSPIGHFSEPADDVSVNSSDSGHSDVDDVPVAATSVRPVSHTPELTFEQKTRRYLLSRKYVLISNVFGTLIAFFMVGQRIERFLHTEAIVSEKYVSFDFKNEHTFGALFLFFTAFSLCDLLIMFLFSPFGSVPRSLREKKAFIGAILDFVLVATCFVLLIVAETKRCCYPDEESNEVSTGDEVESRQLSYGDYYNDPAPCACPPFGSRTYGGLGGIEPYIAIVGLRIFRHWTAAKIVKCLHGIFPKTGKSNGMEMDPFNVFNESFRVSGHGHGHDHRGHSDHGGHEHGSHGGHGELHGTAAELWKSTIGKHPDIAQKYGEFSSEILKLMLDIAIPETLNHGNEGEATPTSPKPSADVASKKPDEQDMSLSLGDEYSYLSAEAQRIILSGKIGRSLQYATSLVDSAHGSIPEDAESAHQPLTALFKLDPTEAIKLQSFEFHSPEARLVRSMRRCDRKLLPILNHWSVVDVVLTRFEMVYFDASHVDNGCPEIKTLREAIIATKGGKGLRLCDIAQGRRVVGRLELSAIENIKVEREVPCPDEEEEHDGPEIEVEDPEFWLDAHYHHHTPSGEPRASRWRRIKQDRLHVKTKLGRELYLRFYSDLEDAEHHPEHLANSDQTLDKNNALQWVQTIGRFCGPEQLHQALPHFGNSKTDEELRDYLEVHDHNLAPRKSHMKRLKSFGDDVHDPNVPRSPSAKGIVPRSPSTKGMIERASTA